MRQTQGVTQGVISLTHCVLTDYVKITEEAGCAVLSTCEHLLDWYAIRAKVFQLALLLAYMFDLLFRPCGLGPDTTDFRFQPKAPLYFQCHIRFRPNVLRHFQPTFGFG